MVTVALLLAAHCPLARSQELQTRSVGRGWPVPVMEFDYVGGGLEGEGQQASWDGRAPNGAMPLERDLFTTKDFYRDRALWSDPRYFRCNSPSTLQAMWGADLTTARVMIGAAPPGSASWGHCEIDYPRAAIVSPYPFKTAQVHYEALLAETKAKGGPTAYTRTNPPPDWNGRYSRAISLAFVAKRAGHTYEAPAYLAEPPQWFFTSINQTSTILSLLTPEYQKRTVQMHYHQSVDNAPLWPAQFCWPDGFMRLFSRQAHLAMDFVTTPERVQLMASSAENFIRHFNVGREFDLRGRVPRLGQDVPRWFGESVAFWDDDTLVTWTSNIVPWITHGVFEFSGQMQTVEIFSPRRDPNGELAGIEHEIVFYDDEALAQPLRLIQVHIKTGQLEDVDPFIYARCIQTIFPVDGRPRPLSPGATIEFTVPDMYGRPWAQIWERYFEDGMERPDDQSIFNFSR
ncbi:MAG TPA: hypothetical protein VNA66_11280 [Gammaproteobacteria bacterium]|nr:hypothetical protein [Gammaproteobacteria bacterium]